MKIPQMFAAIVVLSIFGYIFYELLKFIEKILLPWYREE
jgi:ABC-type nitrate/sulfonate/bicarbonate transport system permease component